MVVSANFDYISNYERPSRQQPSKINITDQNVFFSDSPVDDYQLSLSLDSRLNQSKSYQREGGGEREAPFLDNITNTKMIASPTKSSPGSNKILANTMVTPGANVSSIQNHHLQQMPIIQQPQSINNKLISSSSSSSSSASSTSSSASSSTATSSSAVSSQHATPNAITTTTTTSPVNGSKQQQQQQQAQKSTTPINSSSNASSAYLSVPSKSASNVSSSSQSYSISYLDENNLKMAIVDYTDLLKLVKLQNAIDHHEWLAFNTKMYFDQINILYGAISENCTPQTCATMNAPANTQYHWLDEKNKKCKYSASQYIDTVLTYTAKTISDDSLFPTKVGHAFPASFDAIVKKIHKHLFQVLAHMYHSHYKELLMLQLNGHLNSIYFHFYLFNKSFNLIDEKDLEVLDPLNKCLMAKYLDNSNLSALMQQSHYHQPSIQGQQLSNNNSGSTTTTSGSITSSGFSFLKKKLNFNLMA